MPHSVSLISTIAVGLGLSLILGFIATRLRLPALVGYLVTGMICGPFTPGFVADAEIASQLAEIGIMLLMFGVGLHFSFKDLLAVRRVAVPGALVQMAVATLLGMGLAWSWGWAPGPSLMLGLALSVASTVVLLRALESLGLMQSFAGQAAVGWLVVEDISMVLVLVMLPPLAGALGGHLDAGLAGQSLWMSLGKTLLQVGLFVLVMMVLGRRLFPWLLLQVHRTGSRELFTLCVVAGALSIAYASAALFGVSFALGAFFAGMVMRESEFSHRAAEESLPLRDAFAVLFFMSVGMLFDPQVLLTRPLQVLAVVMVIMLGKTLAAAVLMLGFRYRLGLALTLAASLAQIGEFSFILVGLGRSLGLLPAEGQSLVVAGALFSIALNPFLFHGVEPLRRWLCLHCAWARRLDDESRRSD
ncbi:MAG: cation:proton antiporter [Curvibacter sp.]|nr:cation:proton antiporter [Curvibacter sp.]